MPPTKISYLTDIYFDDGSVEVLAQVLGELGVDRPMMVTDPPLAKLGLLGRLPHQGAAVFDAVPANPTESAVRMALGSYREGGCDGIVAVGGGSSIDLAKAVALLVEHRGSLASYALVNGGAERITPDLPPVVAIPTTAGTGSEVGRAALITVASAPNSGAAGDKLALVSPHLIPRAAICDPQLTMSLPAGLTAATGMDAIAHCVETFCSPSYNPVAEAIAIDGLRRAYLYIRIATAQGDHAVARREMMMAALQGGLTFQKGLGAVHALSHPLGGLADKSLHHGTVNAVLLPHVLRFNAPACPQKLKTIAEHLDVSDPAMLPEVFEDLKRQLHLPNNLREMGLVEADLESMAEKALLDHCSATNPRPMTIENCRDLYAAAW